MANPILLSALLLAASASQCLAGLPFTCKASGDSWSVVGSPTRKVACTLRCVLREAAGNQDVVTCSPTVSPANKAVPICEGFLLGKRWTTATLVAGECSNLEP